MLLGDEFISSGEAYVSGVSVKGDMKQICKDIGYCPQFDALFDDQARETSRSGELLPSHKSTERTQQSIRKITLVSDVFIHRHLVTLPPVWV